jgi:aerobic-type carbon monoxide dehydrogenase small subunit (CoxS/CutS family)
MITIVRTCQHYHLNTVVSVWSDAHQNLCGYCTELVTHVNFGSMRQLFIGSNDPIEETLA